MNFRFVSFSAFLSVLLFLLLSTDCFSQGTVFGPKGGLTLGLQTWNGFDREPLIAYHGAFFIEGYNEESLSALFAQIGYHKRGSAEQILFNAGGGSLFRERQTFEFNNLALILGAKKRLDVAGDNKPYYSFGARIEYTIGTNLDQYNTFGGYFPTDPFVNKINYGATVAFGYEMNFAEHVGLLIEASISPDLSKQYFQPRIPNVIEPFRGQVITLPEQTIRNITFELSVGLRLLRKVVYLN